MFENKSIVYAKGIEVLGSVGEISYLNGTVTIVDGGKELHVVNIEDVEELKYIGVLDDMVVYQKDVFELQDSQHLLEIDLDENGMAKFYVLNEKLERTDFDEKDSFDPSLLGDMSDVLNLIGSIYEIEVEIVEEEEEEEATVDFNIRIVRDSDGDFYYACNDIANEVVDLIKVIYMGHYLLEEENYLRFTFTHEEYLGDVANGALVEVDPSELANFVFNATSKPKQDVTVVKSSDYTGVDTDEEEEEELEEDCDCELCVPTEHCDKCGEQEDECDCSLWSR